jgi:hypothetical protein
MDRRAFLKTAAGAGAAAAVGGLSTPAISQRAARLVPAASSLATNRYRDRARAAAVLLGGEEDGVRSSFPAE